MARLFGKIAEMVEDVDTLVFVLIDEARASLRVVTLCSAALQREWYATVCRRQRRSHASTLPMSHDRPPPVEPCVRDAQG